LTGSYRLVNKIHEDSRLPVTLKCRPVRPGMASRWFRSGALVHWDNLRIRFQLFEVFRTLLHHLASLRQACDAVVGGTVRVAHRTVGSLFAAPMRMIPAQPGKPEFRGHPLAGLWFWARPPGCQVLPVKASIFLDKLDRTERPSAAGVFADFLSVISLRRAGEVVPPVPDSFQHRA